MWQAFWNGVFEALTNTAKVTFWGFFIFWGLYALIGMNLFTFILGHLIVGAYWAYLFKWFRK